jgi:mycothiol synthase
MPGTQITSRAATLADVDPLAELLTRCALAYLGRRSSSQEAFERLTIAGADPRPTAVVVVTEDGTMVGFGNVWEAAPGDIKCFARVGPEMVGRGVGTTLLEHLERRARRLSRESDSANPSMLTGTQWARDTAGRELFTQRGYSEVRFFLRMVADDLSSLDERNTLPAGVTLRSFQVGADEEDLYDAWSDAFAEHWGQSEVLPDTWWRERRDLETAAFDPSLWFVAVTDRIVGLVIAREEVSTAGRIGYISDIGVRPDWRGKGLGYALLVRALAELRRRKLESATLNVDADNRTSALRLYKKVGMREEPNFTIWGKRLD